MPGRCGAVYPWVYGGVYTCVGTGGVHAGGVHAGYMPLHAVKAKETVRLMRGKAKVKAW